MIIATIIMIIILFSTRLHSLSYSNHPRLLSDFESVTPPIALRADVGTSARGFFLHLR